MDKVSIVKLVASMPAVALPVTRIATVQLCVRASTQHHMWLCLDTVCLC
jgi:hypothetical protein